MSSNHCIAHRLHLAGKDASVKVPYFKNYEKILHRIYSYFSRSYKRQKLLHIMQVYFNFVYFIYLCILFFYILISCILFFYILISCILFFYILISHIYFFICYFSSLIFAHTIFSILNIFNHFKSFFNITYTLIQNFLQYIIIRILMTSQI